MFYKQLYAPSCRAGKAKNETRMERLTHAKPLPSGSDLSAQSKWMEEGREGDQVKTEEQL